MTDVGNKVETEAATAPTRCLAVAKSGEQCRAYAMQDGLCHLHAMPEKAKEIGKRGGEQNRHFDPDQDDLADLGELKTAEDVRAMLAQAAADLRCRKIEPRMAASLSQIATTLLKAIEVAGLEMRIRELEEKLGSQKTT